MADCFEQRAADRYGHSPTNSVADLNGERVGVFVEGGIGDHNVARFAFQDTASGHEVNIGDLVGRDYQENHVFRHEEPNPHPLVRCLSQRVGVARQRHGLDVAQRGCHLVQVQYHRRGRHGFT